MTLSEAIIRFDQWRHPWEFHDSVIRARGLSRADRKLFEAAWQEALDFAHWQSADLARCAQLAQAAVRARFPSLSEEACSAIARGASFEMR